MSDYFVKAQSCNFIKNEALAQVFSREICEIFKKIFFTEHLWWLLLNDLLPSDFLADL